MCSELKLKASLEELGIAFEVESIQMPDAVERFEAKVAGKIPVRPRCESLEFASGNPLAVQIDVGEARNQLHSAVTA